MTDNLRQAALTYGRCNYPRYLRQLTQFLRIASISTLPQHRADIDVAAHWLVREMARIGLHNAQVIETAGHPVAYADWLHAGADAPTALIYGHYDVQPPDPLELWQSPPFEPTFREGKVYARGASDNKAQHFSQLKAVESILAATGRLPVNVKFCLDGEEEIGSPTLAAFTITHKDLLQADLILVSDGPMLAPDQPSIDYALRGVVMAEIFVDGPGRDLHSGNYGGAVHNPAQAVAEIVAKLHDENGRVLIPGFYDNVLPLTEAERELLQQVPYPLSQWQAETGAVKPWGEPEYTILERVTARPTCEVNGIWGGFSGEGSKTVLPAKAGVKITMRTVAQQDPVRLARLFTEYVLSIAPDTVQVTVRTDAGSAAAVTSFDSPFIEAAIKA
jgi:acetylornithine deacetylase/succinyl-diaminopimelate desuccinylase-like protein